MLSQYKRTTNIGIGIGFVAVLIGEVFPVEGMDGRTALGLVLRLVGLGFFVWGSSEYAKGKGHSGYWGILGLFYVLGFLILFFLSDRHKRQPASLANDA